MLTDSRPGSLDLIDRKYLTRLIQAVPFHAPVVLIGSWARGSEVDGLSDIDILALTAAPIPKPPPEVQVIVMSVDRFEQRTRAGDDFTQWALRFGRPLSARQRWHDLAAKLLSSAPWPRFDRKLPDAERRLQAARELLEMGDLPAAEEELRFAVSHVARAVLLSHGLCPKSRPELATQLDLIGQTVFAKYVRRLGVPADMTPQTVRFLIGATARHAKRLAASPRQTEQP